MQALAKIVNIWCCWVVKIHLSMLETIIILSQQRIQILQIT